jgi:catechol 2,3-dioxygenase-like lactoylglutathione lyase family enzyme
VIDHISLGAHDLRRAAKFYAGVLEALGYRVLRDTDKEVAFGPHDSWLFFLYPSERNQAVVGARMHVAFHATDRASTSAVHAAAIARGAESVRPVAERPEFGPGYFGGLFRDLDGHLIEVLTRNAA